MVEKRKVTAMEKVAADPASLRYKLKRDPKGYYPEFYDQWLAYDAQRQIFLSAPTTAPANEVAKFCGLLDLISHVADCYPAVTYGYPDDLKALLAQHHAVLNSDLREKIVCCLVLLRRKNMMTSESLLTSLFPVLVSTPSKTLRNLLYTKIQSDLREANSKSANHGLNGTVQTVLHNLVTSDRRSAQGMWAVRLTRELWRRQVPGWRVARLVQIMQEACLCDHQKVVLGGVRFFLGGDAGGAEDESSEDESGATDLRHMQHQRTINKKTKKRAKAYEKALERVKKKDRRRGACQPMNFSALHLLSDPQSFVEKMFEKHLAAKSRMGLASKLLVLSLVTRLIGMEKLELLSLWSWFTKFLSPKQESVTAFLAALAQGTHSLVPPEEISPLVRIIANDFCSEASAAEVAAAGINAIREICTRQPLAMDETLLSDLVQYSRSKDKGVAMAARGLQSLYRQEYPELLQKKFRGKAATMGLRSGQIKEPKFGQENNDGIEGLELLESYKEEQRQKKRERPGMAESECEADQKSQDDGWEDDSSADESDSSGGWINVSSASEDDEPSNKRQRTSDSAVPLPIGGGDGAALSKLATTTILTPADLAKLAELRREAKVKQLTGTTAKRKRELLRKHAEEGLTAADIEFPARIAHKNSKEERVVLAREGKPDREEHKSTHAIRKSRKEAEGKSTTNKDKARKKNFLMTLGKARKKNKRSLVEKKRTLKAHISRSKSGGRRRNGK